MTNLRDLKPLPRRWLYESLMYRQYKIQKIKQFLSSISKSHPEALGLILGVSKNFSEELMLLRLIDGTS